MSYKRKERWTENQLEFLRNNYDKLKDEKIAEVLGRTLKAVRIKRARLECQKISGKGLCESVKSYKKRTGKDPYAKQEEPPKENTGV